MADTNNPPEWITDVVEAVARAPTVLPCIFCHNRLTVSQRPPLCGVCLVASRQRMRDFLAGSFLVAREDRPRALEGVPW